MLELYFYAWHFPSHLLYNYKLMLFEKKTPQIYKVFFKWHEMNLGGKEWY